MYHIDEFVDLLRRDKIYRYLDFLSGLCVCDSVSIADNQNYNWSVARERCKNMCDKQMLTVFLFIEVIACYQAAAFLSSWLEHWHYIASSSTYMYCII